MSKDFWHTALLLAKEKILNTDSFFDIFIRGVFTMNARNFILLSLASYLSLFGMLLVLFDVKRFFKSELMIVILLLIYAVITMPKVLQGKRNAYASATLLFSVLLLNTITLKYLIDMSSSVFAIMLLAGLFGLLVSMRRATCTECVNTEFESQPIIKDVPKYIPEVYDISEKKKQEKKKTAKKAAKKKAVKKKVVKKKKAAKKTTKKKN